MDDAGLADARAFVEAHTWFHTIDLGDGLITPGAKTALAAGAESDAVFSPLCLSGKSVLDIGAWNGYYTLEAARRGAAPILSIDSPTWLSPSYKGKETFDFVMERCGVPAQSLVVDVQTMEPEEIGEWDVVLFLGVFYHLMDPITALERVSRVTKEVLVVETLLDFQNVLRPVMTFYGTGGAQTFRPGTPTRRWAPNRPLVEALLRTFGFARVDFEPHPTHPRRGIFHAYKS
jgi:tRNA (mo5U34)-methyltransferase